MESDEKAKWRKAINDELGQLHKKGTWQLEELLDGREAVGCKWVFLRKKDKDGNVKAYKAQLVAQGFSQKPGTDYSDMGTFSPVMCFKTLQSMLALVAINGWDMQQMDVKGMYMNGWLKEEIYMKQPAGFDDRSG